MRKIFSLFASLLLVGCSDYTESVIPSYPVRLELNTQLTGLPLSTPGGYLLVTNPPTATSAIGYGGVLIVRGFSTDNEIYAYDLACPVENKPSVQLKIKDGIKCYCPKCGSEFEHIFYGNPLPSSGEAKEKNLFLRTYRVTLSNMQVVVYN